jgi:hypothetical protein
MQIIRFAINVPQEVRLNGLEGRLVDSKFGGSQYLFYAAEGVFYVSEAVGKILMDQFRKLDVKAGDPVEITKAEVGNGTGRKTQWIVSTQSDADEQPSELEQKLADSIAVVETRKQAQRAPAANTVQQPEWAQHLINQTCALVDCYAAVMQHASQHANVRGEDVRSIFLSAFINVTKSATGGRNAA